MNARHARDVMRVERTRSLVFQPLDSVVRLDQTIVQRIAVGIEDVRVAVVVEIHDLNTRGPPVRMWRRVEHLRHEREIAFPRVRVGHDGLVLL